MSALTREQVVAMKDALMVYGGKPWDVKICGMTAGHIGSLVDTALASIDTAAALRAKLEAVDRRIGLYQSEVSKAQKMAFDALNSEHDQIMKVQDLQQQLITMTEQWRKTNAQYEQAAKAVTRVTVELAKAAQERDTAEKIVRDLCEKVGVHHPDVILVKLTQVQAERDTLNHVIAKQQFSIEALSKAHTGRCEKFQQAQAENVRLREALGSIARNTCCETCQEAALVAQAALAERQVQP